MPPGRCIIAMPQPIHLVAGLSAKGLLFVVGVVVVVGVYGGNLFVG